MSRGSRGDDLSLSGRHRCCICGLLALALVSGTAWSECPSSSEISVRLDALPLAEASRTQRFGLPVPESLYAKAVAQPGTPIPSRDGKIIQGAMLLPVPIESWWQVINDDDHHAEGGYMPLLGSEVIKGSPGGSGRETFQYYRSFGIGRWWVNRLEANEPLFRGSDGALWELHWRDAMADYPGDEPPVEINSSAAPITEGWGAWLLISLGDSCTMVEYVATGDPGGIVGAVHWMALTRTLKMTFRGMVEMVREHLVEPHPQTVFRRPDGTPIDP